MSEFLGGLGFLRLNIVYLFISIGYCFSNKIGKRAIEKPRPRSYPLHLVFVLSLVVILRIVVSDYNVRRNIENSRFQDELEFIVQLHSSRFCANRQCLKGFVEFKNFAWRTLSGRKRYTTYTPQSKISLKIKDLHFIWNVKIFKKDSSNGRNKILEASILLDYRDAFSAIWDRSN